MAFSGLLRPFVASGQRADRTEYIPVGASAPKAKIVHARGWKGRRVERKGGFMDRTWGPSSYSSDQPRG
eukprot:1134840-Alexandrium_andersonii.AAC.1